ncbi:MAG: DUF488 family protein [Thermoanaerobaculia bacterium]
MAIRIVRLGEARSRGEGVRLGTVRRPPRGVPKERFASEDWYDTWLPNLAPSAELMQWVHTAEPSEANWRRFVQRFRSEMKAPEAVHVIAALALLSHQANFSLGCYCVEESRCHRSVLRDLLSEASAEIR